MDKEILVVIPYLARESQGRELEFAVAGWRAHFKTSYHIVVVGDAHPVTETGGDITHLPCPRIEWDSCDLDNYVPHLDHVHKFRAVHKAFPSYEGFVYACDDMYAVKDFSIDTILYPKIVAKDMGGNIHHPNGWLRDKAKTRALCVAEGLPLWNWVCHLPVYFEWEKLLGIYDKYGMDCESFIVENIYYNQYPPKGEPIVIDGTDGLRCWITNRHEDLGKLENEFSGCTWCCNSTNGWCAELECALAEHYGL